MAVLLTALKILGCILLAVFAVLLIVVLLVLFVPVRYSVSGSIRDPEGSTKMFHLDTKEDLSLAGDVRWLFSALHLSMRVGAGTEKQGLEIRLFGIRFPLEKFKKRAEEKEKEEKPAEEKQDRDLEDWIDRLLDRIERLQRRFMDALHTLETEYGVRAKQLIGRRLLRLLEAVMPSEWGLTGVLGLGDPARSAKVFAVQGFLYPVTAGHVSIGTEYELYRYDLQGAARGAMSLHAFVSAAIIILLNRDVRRTLRKLRRGPSGHKVGGNGKTVTIS